MVEQGSALLVDGGVVSNIPHFLFTGETLHNVKGRKRILLFMLEATEERQRADTFVELVKQLASFAVDGGSSVQLAFTPDLARIVVPTGSIRATDFDEMDSSKIETLVRNGRAAAEAFIKGELLSTHGTTIELRPIADEFEAYLAVSDQLYATSTEVRIAMPDTEWFWEPFPTVLHWRRKGVRIVIFTLPIVPGSPTAPRETQRRSYLSGLGAEVIDCASLPFHWHDPGGETLHN